MKRRWGLLLIGLLLSMPAVPTSLGEGRVVDVRGNTVELEFPAGTSVNLGDRFSLAFEAPRVGRVAIVGSWLVKRIDTNRVQVEAEGPAGQPRIGQIAIPIAPVVAPLAQPTSPATGGSLIPNPPSMSFKEFLERPRTDLKLQPQSTTQTAPPAAISWIGLHLQDLTPELAQTLSLPADTAGTLIADVVAGSPAEQAGLRPGDAVLDVDGRIVTSRQFAEQVRQSTPGTLLRLRIWRDGQRMYLTVRAAAKP